MYVNIEIINIDVALQSGLCKINLFQFQNSLKYFWYFCNTTQEHIHETKEAPLYLPNDLVL